MESDRGSRDRGTIAGRWGSDGASVQPVVSRSTTRDQLDDTTMTDVRLSGSDDLNFERDVYLQGLAANAFILAIRNELHNTQTTWAS